MQVSKSVLHYRLRDVVSFSVFAYVDLIPPPRARMLSRKTSTMHMLIFHIPLRVHQTLFLKIARFPHCCVFVQTTSYRRVLWTAESGYIHDTLCKLQPRFTPYMHYLHFGIFLCAMENVKALPYSLSKFTPRISHCSFRNCTCSPKPITSVS